MKKSAYAASGVDIDEKMAGLRAIRKMVDSTASSAVLSGIGMFGGMIKSPGAGKVLVASTDGVGTKLKVASMAKRYDTVGQDIVNHCVNDILVQGAEPLFFLDYIAASRLSRDMIKQVIFGLCKACRENECALLGGETAEMPGVYAKGEYDLVGTIVGTVDRNKIVSGRDIKPGDVILGLPSSGLHTNGYSLARRVIFEKAGLRINDFLPGSTSKVGNLLLAPHLSYLEPVRILRKHMRIHGMAHITGGGFPDNIPRVLPDNIDACIDRTAWNMPALFKFIMNAGKVDRDEMYRVFNMGIGYVVILSESDAGKAVALLRKHCCKPAFLGYTRKGHRRVVYSK